MSKKTNRSIVMKKAWATRRANASNGAKRGRKPGVKVGPYKLNLSQMMKELKELRAKVAKLEKVLS